jgi:hypothetical protein
MEMETEADAGGVDREDEPTMATRAVDSGERALQVTIPADLRRRVESWSAERSISLDRLVTDALELYLSQAPHGPEPAHPWHEVGEDAVERSLARVERVLGLSQAELAALLGVVAPRLPEPAALSAEARRRLARLDGLAAWIEQTFAPDSIAPWLHASSRDLDGRTPLEMLRAGRIDAVEAALEALDSGVYV